MKTLETTIWFVEHNLGRPITLGNIAKACGVSNEHLARTFSLSVGISPIAYLRKRRLSEAAKVILAQQKPITDIALDFDYGSQEAFARAFRSEFNISPGRLRKSGNLDQLNLTETFMIDNANFVTLDEPRFETRDAFCITGFSQRFTHENSYQIPQLWEKLGPHLGNIPGQLEQNAFGVSSNFSEGEFDYLAGVRTSADAEIEQGMTRLEIEPAQYAVFAHKGHVSEIKKVFFTICNQWFEKSGFEATGTPEFEYYREDFDAETGIGTTEIWMPIRAIS